MDFQKGLLLANRYHLQKELGKGGFGTVWLAHDQVNDRLVAIKQYAPLPENEENALKRFRREIDIIKQFDHPHIVKLFDADVQANYFVLEYKSGGALRPKRYKLTEMCAWLRQLADALDYANQKQILHRDVKPGNILLGDSGHACLSDFGIARPHATPISQRVTAPSTENQPDLCTLDYAAPEVLVGKSCFASDLYALGITFFQFLTGELPYKLPDAKDGNMQAALKNAILGSQIRPITDYGNPFKPFVPVFAKVFQAEPTQRYPTALAFATAFLKAASSAGMIPASQSDQAQPYRKTAPLTQPKRELEQQPPAQQQTMPLQRLFYCEFCGGGNTLYDGPCTHCGALPQSGRW